MRYAVGYCCALASWGLIGPNTGRLALLGVTIWLVVSLARRKPPTEQT